jgi:hypothetical protein
MPSHKNACLGWFERTYGPVTARSDAAGPEGVVMDVGQQVRALRSLDLGDAGKVEKGAVGVLESINNGPYMPYLVRFASGTFAFEEGEIEEAGTQPA